MLEEYREKRNFSVTSEPKGGVGGRSGIFVIQEHWASHWHHDFRIERDGVLKSWAIPKGFPKNDERRLAVPTEDHPLEYADFEGVIPEGMYGAGTVSIYDRGKANVKVWEKDKIEFELHGKRVKGLFVMIRTKVGWLIFRKRVK
ncbi:MAG: DNA polymerase ligase N-terminal domain-containing protein [Candidatus Micrarchaeia archaeon]